VAIIDEVKNLCDRLAPLGWRDLLQRVTGNELDIRQASARALGRELTKTLASIDRALPGFEDFSPDGDRAVSPAQPALSLLYHALAIPLVKRDHQGRPLQGFPTPAELDFLENFIFSLARPSLPEFIQQNGGASKVAIAVFSCEYRSAAETVDGRHADLTFSRTGIARIGTSGPRYHAVERGFWPEDEDNGHRVRVLPARFSAWLAVRKKGREARVSPILDNSRGQAADEANRDFWIPVHKLFPGGECLQDLDVSLQLTAKLFNLKIQRIHRALKTSPLPAGYPYVITDGDIADWSTDPAHGPGWLVPTVRPRLVEPAIIDGKSITYKVTPKRVDVFAAIEPPGKHTLGELEINPAPSYIHGRTRVVHKRNDIDRFIDLNDELDVVRAMKAKPYEALHYVDHTGEGWVAPAVEGLGRTRMKLLPAYALIAAPDFFPSTGQFQVSEWSRSPEIPARFKDELWNVPPTPLSETRLPANLQLPNSPFAASDETVTAVVGRGVPKTPPSVWPPQPQVMRSSCLPDDAAGVFAPGWDVGVDRLPSAGRPPHLAGYSLGSPFPEDAKLCAALSTFWPAVAPDVFRTFATGIGNTSGTVSPLTDEEIGQEGSLPWDGIPGPRAVVENGVRLVEVASFLNADYVQKAAQNSFCIRLTARVGAAEYEARMLAISRAYSVAGNLGSIQATRAQWLVLSFRAVSPGDGELQQAQSDVGTVLSGQAYRIQLCRNVPVSQRSSFGPRLQRFPLRDLRSFFASARSVAVLTKAENDPQWAAAASEA